MMDSPALSVFSSTVPPAFRKRVGGWIISKCRGKEKKGKNTGGAERLYEQQIAKRKKAYLTSL